VLERHRSNRSGRGALHADGKVLCWGANDSGALGMPPSEYKEDQPVARLDHVTAIAAGGDHTCAVR
jgi:alpha-tubulin suppressor-like RCC1 family protein